MAPLPAAGDVRLSELMDLMKALMLLEEFDWPSILFMLAFLTCPPADFQALCVTFAWTGSLVDVARHVEWRSSFGFAPCSSPGRPVLHKTRTGSTTTFPPRAGPSTTLSSARSPRLPTATTTSSLAKGTARVGSRDMRPAEGTSQSFRPLSSIPGQADPLSGFLAPSSV